MGEMSFNGGRDEGEGVAALLAAGFNHRQHRLDEAATACTLRPKRQLPPYHRMTQRSFASVVCRLDPFMLQKRPQPLAMLVQLPARPAHIAIVALHSAQQQTFHLPADWSHPTLQCRSRNFAGAIIGPMLEQLAGCVSQALSKPLGPRVASVDHRLKITFQMRPAPLQIASFASTISPDHR